MISTFTQIETYTIICCPTVNCGALFGIPHSYENRRREDKESFYCPNGHSMSYGESDADKLRKEKQRLEKTIERREADLRFEQSRLVDERRSHAATKGKLTKSKNRAAHGICPAPGCKRSFANVARHVASQHPEFVESIQCGGKY